MRKKLIFITILSIIVWSFCLVSIAFIDQPLTLLVHRHTGSIYPFFESFTWLCDHLFLGFVFYKLPFNLWSILIFLVLRYGILSAMGLGAKFLLGQAYLARAFVFAIVVHVSTTAVVVVTRHAIKRARPETLIGQGHYDLDFFSGEGSSFPSGHAADYFGLFMPFAFAFPRYRLWILIIPVLISAGRIFLKMHYLSDVVFSTYLVVMFTVLWKGYMMEEKHIK